jgi:hypothetical protein
MYCLTPVGVVGALLWILLGMSVVAPLLWAIVILLLDLTLATQVSYINVTNQRRKRIPPSNQKPDNLDQPSYGFFWLCQF